MSLLVDLFVVVVVVSVVIDYDDVVVVGGDDDVAVMVVFDFDGPLNPFNDNKIFFLEKDQKQTIMYN